MSPVDRNKKVEQLYAEELGEQALERQKNAAKLFYWCCAESVQGPHHVVCKNYVEEPVIVDGQETLL